MIKVNMKHYMLLFISKAFFSTQPQCCITFSWIELQMLLRFWLIHKALSIIILRHFLYLLFSCPCLELGLYMFYLCDLFLNFIFILIMINRIISWLQAYLFFYLFVRICPIIFGWQHGWRMNNFQIAKV